ncbi:lipoprotein bor [Vibrio sp. SNU_ST1]|uniref:Bor family protein n=1 Tax=Vibrio sp. SNU_ST1 TaxID=3064001 RepID=UPI002729D53A|nr:lipoprotein bor [Vibrio sp. SNU_ST1]WKY60088.1 lipoprotein bor [Vibrio sp. SNU_ST1]
MKKLLIIAALSLVATGCAQQTFVMAPQESEATAPTTEKSHHFFINGLAQKKQIDAAEVCNGIDNVAKVEVQETFVNGLLATLTFGIYTPREARVYCKA